MNRLAAKVVCNIIAAAVVLMTVDSASADIRSIIQTGRPATVFLSTKVKKGAEETIYSGTGVIISSEGYVLTARHVIPDGKDGIQEPTYGQKQSNSALKEELEFVAQDPFFDAALLKFKNTAGSYPAAVIGSHAPQIGDQLVKLGFPLGQEFDAKPGHVSGLGGPHGSIVSDLVLNPGDSGAPIFDDKGQLVALVVSDLTGGRGISFLLPVTHATTLLNIARVATTVKPQTSTIHASLVTAPPIAVPPPPGACTCISESHPPSPGGRPGPHAPYPTGAISTVTNNCATDISVFALGDTNMQSMAAPMMSPANGRRFAYETLKPGQTLEVDLSGMISGYMAANGCPATSFISPQVLPMPQQLQCFVNPSELPPGTPTTICAAPPGGTAGSPCACPKFDASLRQIGVYQGQVRP